MDLKMPKQVRALLSPTAQIQEKALLTSIHTLLMKLRTSLMKFTLNKKNSWTISKSEWFSGLIQRFTLK